jgi:hypothetical protein
VAHAGPVTGQTVIKNQRSPEGLGVGMLSKIFKAGLAKKAVDIAIREAKKPENQAKARELVARARDRRAQRSRPRDEQN